jgi:glycosyltransferase involved in cell wall biosynthesis
VVHSNQYCFGGLEIAAPRLVVAHSDLLSWIAWHRRGGHFDPAEVGRDPQLCAYRDLVAAGLEGASITVAPSRSMAHSLLTSYGVSSRVIHNGLWPYLYPSGPKGDGALIAGRLWDESKRAEAAVKATSGLPLELRLVGPTVGPAGERARLPSSSNSRYLGSLSWRETRSQMAVARYYLATSSYEPFGLAALEAAFCGCALLANDTPFHREIWGDAALYFPVDDPAELRAELSVLLRSPAEAEELGVRARARALERYTADRMADEYFALYQALLSGAPGAPSAERSEASPRVGSPFASPGVTTETATDLPRGKSMLRADS